MNEGFRTSEVQVVKEDRRVVHACYAFLLLLVVGGTVAVLTLVEQPPDVARENRIAMLVVGGSASIALAARWIYEARHPARIEIYRDRIVAKRRGRTTERVLQWAGGELAFSIESFVVGKHASVKPVLIVPNSDQVPIGIEGYDAPNIRRACEALGWRFVE